jgi:hypothetical protein
MCMKCYLSFNVATLRYLRKFSFIIPNKTLTFEFAVGFDLLVKMYCQQFKAINKAMLYHSADFKIPICYWLMSLYNKRMMWTVSFNQN